MSISAEPLNEPRSEIWITRESIVASTEPSTTRVSQSVISTPLSLMFGPTVSLLSPSFVAGGGRWGGGGAPRGPPPRGGGGGGAGGGGALPRLLCVCFVC